jgi:hypothetical protein
MLQNSLLILKSNLKILSSVSFPLLSLASGKNRPIFSARGYLLKDLLD